MTAVLIAYATTEGQTRKVAEAILDHLARLKVGATLRDVTEAGPAVAAGGFDAVILAGSIHVGRHAPALVHFVRDHLDAINAAKTALVQVSLSVVSEDPDELAETSLYAEQFVAETGLRLDAVHYAAGALRFTRYDYFKRWIARDLARTRGLAVTPGADIEYTDWRALEAFVGDFVARQLAPAA